MSEGETVGQGVRQKSEGEIILSRYRTAKCLGSGGMGTVFLAEDTTLRRPVAIKTIREDLARDSDFRKRIDRECLLHAKVGAHPHIVTLFDKVEENGQIHLIMEYVEGMDLEDLVADRQARGIGFSPRDAICVCSQCLDALARIHAHGVVHRDIKPGNIMVGRDDSGGLCAKLMDFGIARLEDDHGELSRLTRTQGASPGTPLYMAPEQIDPQTFGPVSHSTDVYAVGVMLYQLLSGHPPYTGTITQVLNGHVNAAPPELDAEGNLPVPLGVLVRKALAKQPRDRFASAKAFREALDGVLAELDRDGTADFAAQTLLRTAVLERPGKTVVAATVSAPEPTAGQTVAAGTTTAGVSPKRSRLVALLGVVAVAVALAAAGFYIWHRAGTGPEPGTPASQQSGVDARPAGGPAPAAPEAVQPLQGPQTAPPQETAAGNAPADAGAAQSSAMDALLTGGGEEPANASAAEEPPAPAVEPSPDTAKPPEPKPAAAAEPAAPVGKEAEPAQGAADQTTEPEPAPPVSEPAKDPEQKEPVTEEPKKEESSSETPAKKNPWADVKPKYSTE